MPRVTAVRAVNVPVEDPEACLGFYRDRLGMVALPDVLPGGTMCRWDRDHDGFVGLRRRDAADRLWRYPYGRAGDWDHAELYLAGSTDGLDPVETGSRALVLADPEDRALEALPGGGGSVEVPGIAEVGLAVADLAATRAYYADLGFEPAGWEGGDRFVLRAESGQRWTLVERDEPGFHHVAFLLDPLRFRDVVDRLPRRARREGERRASVEDPEGRTVVLATAEGVEPGSSPAGSDAVTPPFDRILGPE